MDVASDAEIVAHLRGALDGPLTGAGFAAAQVGSEPGGVSSIHCADARRLLARYPFTAVAEDSPDPGSCTDLYVVVTTGGDARVTEARLNGVDVPDLLAAAGRDDLARAAAADLPTLGAREALTRLGAWLGDVFPSR
ncbi:hypothetical protein [Cellulomonas sp.]|uniref:hypothetical protein n=1 Tax=Cellulomonas sp. TaxID=40001 RepID=UPI002D6A3B31|nr:hypothetical protein [Cellulomonas sp.]HYQ75258.1 hypothetical protein [Cellulomonas sp.]